MKDFREGGGGGQNPSLITVFKKATFFYLGNSQRFLEIFEVFKIPNEC